jgi:hypothetical protein
MLVRHIRLQRVRATNPDIQSPQRLTSNIGFRVAIWTVLANGGIMSSNLVEWFDEFPADTGLPVAVLLATASPKK